MNAVKSLSIFILVLLFTIPLFSQNVDIEGSWYEINVNHCQENLLDCAEKHYYEFTFDNGLLTTSCAGGQRVGTYILEDNQLILDIGSDGTTVRTFELTTQEEQQIAFEWREKTIVLRRLNIETVPDYLNQYSWLNMNTATGLMRKRLFTVLIQDNLVSKSKILQFLENMEKSR